jgi:hypothetical protein
MTLCFPLTSEAHDVVSVNSIIGLCASKDRSYCKAASSGTCTGDAELSRNSCFFLFSQTSEFLDVVLLPHHWPSASEPLPVEWMCTLTFGGESRCL